VRNDNSVVCSRHPVFPGYSLTTHYFVNFASAGDTGNEKTDKARPRDPEERKRKIARLANQANRGGAKAQYQSSQKHVPPGLVKDNPGVHEPSRGGAFSSATITRAELTKGVGPEVETKDTVLEEVTNLLNDKVHEELGVVHGEDQELQDHSEDKGQQREELDTGIESGDHTGRSNSRDTPDGEVLDGSDAIFTDIIIDPSKVLLRETGELA
jgi:hypothetical protein